jgi:hypothetical protein
MNSLIPLPDNLIVGDRDIFLFTARSLFRQAHREWRVNAPTRATPQGSRRVISTEIKTN